LIDIIDPAEDKIQENSPKKETSRSQKNDAINNFDSEPNKDLKEISISKEPNREFSIPKNNPMNPYTVPKKINLTIKPSRKKRNAK
jgi:hypothetical protein